SIQLADFRRVNEFMSEPFQAKRGYSLDALLSALWGISNIALAPARILFSEDSDQPDLFGPSGLMTLNMHNFMQRAYATFAFKREGPIEEILLRAEIFEAAIRPKNLDDLRACVQVLTLNEAHQAGISLWSGGPRFPIVPFGESCLILDLLGLSSI